MTQATRRTRRSSSARLVCSALTVGGALLVASGCAGPRVWYPPPPPQGLSRVLGWNSQSVFFPGRYGPEHQLLAGEGRGQVEEVIDINGEVGHPLTVESPRASCLPGGGWTGSPSVAIGSLPPGLGIGYQQALDIGGIPTERGHWIVTMALSNLTCNGVSYGSFQQQLRFHITGSGRVTQ